MENEKQQEILNDLLLFLFYRKHIAALMCESADFL